MSESPHSPQEHTYAIIFSISCNILLSPAPRKARHANMSSYKALAFHQDYYRYPYFPWTIQNDIGMGQGPGTTTPRPRRRRRRNSGNAVEGPRKSAMECISLGSTLWKRCVEVSLWAFPHSVALLTVVNMPKMEKDVCGHVGRWMADNYEERRQEKALM
ncbi:hypothetical protein Bbelb_291570 [Branchiostoma belcheri]|nr:hypothetical protein Bbelb_291570 [Branchiostoma belcheri]